MPAGVVDGMVAATVPLVVAVSVPMVVGLAKEPVPLLNCAVKILPLLNALLVVYGTETLALGAE